MKKLLILAVLLIGCSTLQAQDWKDALSKAATSAADKVTGGKLTQMAITGRWEYSGPGVKFESDDTLSELGGSALSSQRREKTRPGLPTGGNQTRSLSFHVRYGRCFRSAVRNPFPERNLRIQPRNTCHYAPLQQSTGQTGFPDRPCLPERLTDAAGLSERKTRGAALGNRSKNRIAATPDSFARKIQEYRHRVQFFQIISFGYETYIMSVRLVRRMRDNRCFGTIAE